MVKKYYKICYCGYNGGYLFSYAKNRLEDVSRHLPVEYKMNEWVLPNMANTKLMVFDTLEHAKQWLDRDCLDRGCNKIFECEVKNPVKKSIFRKLSGMVDYVNFHTTIQMCLHLKQNKKSYLHLCEQPPQGTVFVSAVKLIKEVK